MITKAQATSLHYGQELHYTGRHACTRTVGPRGGVKMTVTTVRQSGQCKVWKRDPNRFRVPVKYGMYESSYIDETNCADYHLASDCPLLNQVDGNLRDGLIVSAKGVD